MTKTQNLDTQIADAEAEREAITQRLADTEAAIIAGDTKKTLGDIEALEREARVTDLQIRALHTRRDEEAETARLAGIKTIREEILASDIGSPDYFIAILNRLETAVLDLIAAGTNRREQMQEWKNRLYALGATPKDDEYGVTYVDEFSIGGARLRVDGITIGNFDPQSYIDAVVREPDPKIRTVNLENNLRVELGQIPKR